MPWTVFFPLGSPLGQIKGAPAVITRKPDTTNVYARGEDDRVWQNAFFDGEWHDWEPHKKAIAGSPPAACSTGPNHEQVFVTGKNLDVLRRRWTPATGWSEWDSLGGQTLHAPAAISRRPEVRNVYVRGLDGGLWQKAFFDGHWHEWEPHHDGAQLSEAPAVTSFGPDHEQVFIRATDRAVWTKEWTAGGGWTGWTPLDGDIKGAPAAVSRRPGVVNVYARGLDDRLWQRAFFDGQWHDWVQHGDGFPLSDSPSAASAGPDHEHIYVRGRDGRVWTKWWEREVSGVIRVHIVDLFTGTLIVDDINSMYGQLAHMANVYRAGSPTFWIEVVSANSLMDANFISVDVGACKGSPTDHQKSLFSLYRFGAPGNEIVLYFVAGTSPTKNGCATHPSGQPGAVVAVIGAPWTMAHEMGHVLGLSHVDDSTRLMTGGGTWNVTDPPPELSQDERNAILGSGFVF